MTDTTSMLVGFVLPFVVLGLLIALVIYVPQKAGKISVILSAVSAVLTFLMIPIVTLSPAAIYLGVRAWRLENKRVSLIGVPQASKLSFVPMCLATFVFVMQVVLSTQEYRV